MLNHTSASLFCFYPQGLFRDQTLEPRHISDNVAKILKDKVAVAFRTDKTVKVQRVKSIYSV